MIGTIKASCDGSVTIIKWHVSNGIPGGADSKASTYDMEDPGSFFFFFFHLFLLVGS